MTIIMTQIAPFLSVLLLLVLGVLGDKHGLVPVVIDGEQYRCKCSPSDRCWPSTRSWASLNATVHGNLVAHVPPAAVCHDTFRGKQVFSEAGCAEAKANWRSLDWQISRPGSAIWTWASNNTCELTDDPSSSCTMGNYPEYVIMAKKKKHIKAGIDFARSRSIRLVIRNTGHDFESRSSGAGSLAINTHNLKDIKFTKRYRGPGDYRGPAVTIGAGVQGTELLKAAHAQNPPQTVITGECGTVGIAGGFVQGGGHGPLTSMYGFAADNALSFDVVDSKGRFITANARENSDLFWALKGGGPGNYAVVLSVTMRTFPDNMPTAGIYLNVNASTGAPFPQVLEAANTFHHHANHLVENGLYAIYELFVPQVLGALRVKPIMGFNMTATQLDAILKPMFDDLDKQGITYDTGTKEYPDYYSIYRDLFPPEPAALNALTGGWVLNRKDLRPENQDAIAEAVEMSLFPKPGVFSMMLGHLFDPRLTVTKPNSATNPRWKNATIRIMPVMYQPLNATWDQKVGLSNIMAHQIQEKYKEVAPDGLGYVNEGYPWIRDWQEVFWGENYSKLKTIKKRWDPTGVFYSPATPGAEDWRVVDYAHRLCKNTWPSGV